MVLSQPGSRLPRSRARWICGTDALIHATDLPYVGYETFTREAFESTLRLEHRALAQQILTTHSI